MISRYFHASITTALGSNYVIATSMLGALCFNVLTDYDHDVLHSHDAVPTNNQCSQNDYNP